MISLPAPHEKVSAPPVDVPFQAHVELLRFFLANRAAIVERIQAVLSAQRRPAAYLQDAGLLARHCEDCFFIGATEAQSRLRGQLEQAHWAAGFRPRHIPGLHNTAAEPGVMMTRAFHLWEQTRWPGRNGRVRYAHTLFNLYVLRCLELLTMRLWDAESSGAGDRLAQVQEVLDALWSLKTADQPVLVRDARWLLQTAQSLATDDLGAYFDIAERIAESLPEDDRLETHTAAVRMTGGHLRSQVRYHATKNAASLDEASVVLSTRESNALDFALLVQDLVPLLESYEEACQRDDHLKRIELADAICQGISPDPELFLNRVELLGAYSMLEHLFITTDHNGQPVYTATGRRHLGLVQQYVARIRRVSARLCEDCARFRPIAGTYSPFGVLYGFSSDLLKHMVLKASQPDAENRFSLEDVFVAGEADKLAWVSGWRKLPHISRELQSRFDYPQQFAEDVFERLEQALRRCVLDDETGTGAPAGRLFIVPSDDPQGETPLSAIEDVPVRYIVSSDLEMVAAHKAEPYPEAQVAADRLEGKFLVSYQTPRGWVGMSKSILTDVLGAGRDVKIAGLPPAAARALILTCPGLIVRQSATGPAGS